MINPFRQSDGVPENYNRTEVELARIREAEETRRQRTAGREKTRQAALGSDGYWIIRGLWAIACVLMTLMAYFAYTTHVNAYAPSIRCTESTELINEANAARSCPGGGWAEVHPMPDGHHALLTCRCDPKPATSAP